MMRIRRPLPFESMLDDKKSRHYNVIFIDFRNGDFWMSGNEKRPRGVSSGRNSSMIKR
jgi:hypothetical protein